MKGGWFDFVLSVVLAVDDDRGSHLRRTVFVVTFCKISCVGMGAVPGLQVSRREKQLFGKDGEARICCLLKSASLAGI